MSDLQSTSILVTGASSGLGRAMCEILARTHRANLVISARRADRLDALAAELRADAGIDVVTEPADLTRRDDVERLLARSIECGVRGAILNAGVTYYGHHDHIDAATIDAIIRTNVDAVTTLTRGLLPAMDATPGARLMLVSSMAGSIPLPFQAVYSASKAYVTAFGRALQAERPSGPTSITVYAPGGIATEMLSSSGLSKKFRPNQLGIMPVARAADAGVRAFIARKRFVVPGFVNKLSHASARFLPRGVIAGFLRRTYDPPK